MFEYINEQIKLGYEATRDFCELKRQKREGFLSSEELRRLWDLEIGCKDNFLSYGVYGIAGYCLYFYSHPIKTLKALELI